MEEEDLVRGATRSGDTLRGISKRDYGSLAELKRAHARVFSLEPSFYLAGD
jgi:hypothetical protein